MLSKKIQKLDIHLGYVITSEGVTIVESCWSIGIKGTFLTLSMGVEL